MALLDTQTLIGMRQRLPKFEPFFLNRFFPSVFESKEKYVVFDDISEDVKLAPFVSPVIAGRPQVQDGVTSVKLTPPYLKPTHDVNPDQALTRMAGETFEAPKSPDERHDLIVMNLIGKQERQITHREEWMAVQAVMTGTITVSGDAYPTTLIDFGRAAGNNIDLVGGAEWDAVNIATYDPSADIETWAAASSVVSDMLVFSPDAWAVFATFTAVKDKLDTRRGSKSELELGPQLSKTVAFKGYFGEYACYVYKGKYVNDAGSEVNFMPAGTVLVAPSYHDDVRCYGAIQDAKAYREGVSASARYVKNWIGDDPGTERVQTQSAPLPVTLDPNAYVAVTVL
jgi:hypothetical protein